MCKTRFNNIEKYNLHLYYHRNYKNVLFECKYKDCYATFVSYNSFKSHVWRNHSLLKSQNYTPKCSANNCFYVTNNRKEYHSHIYNHIRNNKTISCPYVQYCKADNFFTTVEFLKSHIFRKHSNQLSSINYSANLTVPVGDVNYYNDKVHANNIISTNQNSLCADNTKNTCNVKENFEELRNKLLANLYIVLVAKHFLTEVSLQTIINGMTDFNNLNSEYLLSQVAESEKPKLKQLLSDNLFNKAHNSNDGTFRSKFVRKKYFENNFNYVALEYYLYVKNKYPCFYYIPIFKTLNILFQDPDALEQLLYNNTQFNNIVFTDINSGLCCHNNPLLSDNKNIKIIFYHDAFEPCNPIGPSKKNTKS